MSRELTRTEVDGTQRVISIQDYLQHGSGKDDSFMWDEQRKNERGVEVVAYVLLAAFVTMLGLSFYLGYLVGAR